MDQAIGATGGPFVDAPPVPAGQDTRTGKDTAGSEDAGQSIERRHHYAGREWSSEHSLNVRVSIPLGVGRYYITLVAGKERRARARLALDRRQNPLDTPGNVLFLAFVSVIGTVGGITLIYLMLAHFFGWSGRLML